MAEKEYKIADGECRLYEAQKNLSERPRNKCLLKVVEDTRKEVDELKGKGDKVDVTEKDSMSPHQAPTVQVEEPNGMVRTATGLSISSHMRPRE